MAADNLQLQRLELKYIINEATALAVRDFVSSYLQVDEFGATQPDLSYPVHSLYLDSDQLSLYWHTINGNKNRYKLRLRFYDNQPDSPVFFEIKRRMNDAIMKERGGVRRSEVDRILAGHLPDPSQLIHPTPKSLAAILHFSQLMQEHHARPKAHVAYRREAWISPQSNAVRVTMDRDVCCDPEPTARLSTGLVNPVIVFGKSVVLELKFTGRFPDWFKDLARVFGLKQCSAAKYADGIALGGERRFSPAGYVAPPEPEALHHREDRRQALIEIQNSPLHLSCA